MKMYLHLKMEVFFPACHVNLLGNLPKDFSQGHRRNAVCFNATLLNPALKSKTVSQDYNELNGMLPICGKPGDV